VVVLKAILTMYSYFYILWTEQENFLADTGKGKATISG
jgi:hypothetical protein